MMPPEEAGNSRVEPPIGSCPGLRDMMPPEEADASRVRPPIGNCPTLRFIIPPAQAGALTSLVPDACGERGLSAGPVASLVRRGAGGRVWVSGAGLVDSSAEATAWSEPRPGPLERTRVTGGRGASFAKTGAALLAGKRGAALAAGRSEDGVSFLSMRGPLSLLLVVAPLSAGDGLPGATAPKPPPLGRLRTGSLAEGAPLAPTPAAGAIVLGVVGTKGLLVTLGAAALLAKLENCGLAALWTATGAADGPWRAPGAACADDVAVQSKAAPTLTFVRSLNLAFMVSPLRSPHRRLPTRLQLLPDTLFRLQPFRRSADRKDSQEKQWADNSFRCLTHP